jgi:hypothetical protein
MVDTTTREAAASRSRPPFNFNIVAICALLEVGIPETPGCLVYFLFGKAETGRHPPKGNYKPFGGFT